MSGFITVLDMGRKRAFVLPLVEDVLEESLFSSEKKVLVHLSFLWIAFSYKRFP